MDDDYIVGALFLDLSRAFGLIDHELLLKKMQLEFGAQGNAEEWWFRSYLSGRHQRVCVGQATSCWQTPRFWGSMATRVHFGAIDVHPLYK